MKSKLTRTHGAKRKRRGQQKLNFGKLEDRKMFAAVGYTSTAVLDFDSEWMNNTQLEEGRWELSDFESSAWFDNGVSFPSFNSLFTNSRPWLDLNNSGSVNNTDATIAIDRIMAKVNQDFSPYDLDILIGDQDSYRSMMGDGTGDADRGDVTVIISGGSSNVVDSQGNIRTGFGYSPIDAGNNYDTHAFVFAGGSVSSFSGNADQWLNQVARTISHEMGHGFGLEHQVGSSDLDSISHSTMGIGGEGWTRDWSHDFSFHDRSYQVQGSSDYQNSHQHLDRSDILGPSTDSWMAVLRPGELTIEASEAWVNDNFSIFPMSGNRWRVTHNSDATFVDIDRVGTESLNPFNDALSRVRIHSHGGNDTILMARSMNVPLYAYGGAGNDILRGGAANDVLAGGDGDDFLAGYEGNDYLFGQAGNDRLYGLEGTDQLFGSFGNDVMSGGDDDDNMYGGQGDDIMAGHGGNDRMYGHAGNDRLYGYDGNDLLDGGKDGKADFLWGGTGADDFVREMYWDWSFWTNWSYKNREIVSGFSSGQGDQLI